RRQPVLHREVGDAASMGIDQWLAESDQRGAWLLVYLGEHAVELFDVLHLEVEEFQTKRLGRDLHVRQKPSGDRIVRIMEVADTRSRRRGLFEQFYPLSREPRAHGRGRSRDIPAWPGEARHETNANRITDSDKDYRNRLSRPARRLRRLCRPDDYDLYVE